MQDQERYEDSHLGGYRRIYPGPDSEKYAPFFKHNGSLFQETAASKAREECARYLGCIFLCTGGWGKSWSWTALQSGKRKPQTWERRNRAKKLQQALSVSRHIHACLHLNVWCVCVCTYIHVEARGQPWILSLAVHYLVGASLHMPRSHLLIIGWMDGHVYMYVCMYTMVHVWKWSELSGVSCLLWACVFQYHNSGAQVWW